MNKRTISLAAAGAVALAGVGTAIAVGDRAVPVSGMNPYGTAKPKNVIFFLGDGMGTQEITAARYYAYGARGRMNVDRMGYTGFDTTWSVKPDGKPDYDPDSASTGT